MRDGKEGGISSSRDEKKRRDPSAIVREELAVELGRLLKK